MIAQERSSEKASKQAAEKKCENRAISRCVIVAALSSKSERKRSVASLRRAWSLNGSIKITKKEISDKHSGICEESGNLCRVVTVNRWSREEVENKKSKEKNSEKTRTFDKNAFQIAGCVPFGGYQPFVLLRLPEREGKVRQLQRQSLHGSARPRRRS